MVHYVWDKLYALVIRQDLRGRYSSQIDLVASNKDNTLSVSLLDERAEKMKWSKLKLAWLSQYDKF